MMNVEEIRNYCLGKQMVSEGLPFGDDTLVFKVAGKIFALMNLEGDLRVNLKCEPHRAVELREKYEAVIPGYHMNKTHWNTVILDLLDDPNLLIQWIDHSYEQIVLKLPKKIREEISIG